MKTKVTPLGRLVVALALIAGAAVAGAAGANATKPRAQAWRCVLVRSGDTLWSLARTVSPGVDPRRAVGQIIERNHLPGAAIAAGDALWVPWESDGPLPGGAECGFVP